MMKRKEMNGILRFRTRILSLCLVAFLVGATLPVSAEDFQEQQALVEKAKITLENFVADPNSKWFRENTNDAKGLFLVPQMMRGAFIFGGAGGSGVLVVRDEKTGEWSQPAFYTIGSASFGLQIGADVSELVMIITSTKGLESFYSTDFKLGVDVSIAAGPVGAGVSGKGITTDIVSYAKSKGLYGGFSLEGSGIAVSSVSNTVYYGKPVRPMDILVKKSVTNPNSAKLRAAAGKAIGDQISTSPAKGQ